MTQDKRSFVQSYIDKLNKELTLFRDIEPTYIQAAENSLFDTIFEIRNVFSTELPQIQKIISCRRGSGERDANSVLGILNLYLIDEESNDSQYKQEQREKAHDGRAVKNKKIFISHRSTNKDVADILETFLNCCGISPSHIFCSSLPGNDVKQEIAGEIKEAIRESCLNIVILSEEYYQSAYCQNEAGIIWFLDAQKIVIALPDINSSNMQGFLNSQYILRRLDNKSDIMSILDNLKTHFDLISSNAKIESNATKLMDDYINIMKGKTSLQGQVNAIKPDKDGYYHAKILDIHDDAIIGHRFYKIDGCLHLENVNTELDESHWICDWDRTFKSFRKNDIVKFRIRYTKLGELVYHNGKPVKNFRNITPEPDIQKVSG
ncbi:MAG: toll/interleukin-1 receptor domain-containing protein [Oscillospiraceae bacterium]|nr:toll/interleukin-1 receptor domain-containing protein [Oscillospiraceae bacterium]